MKGRHYFKNFLGFLLSYGFNTHSLEILVSQNVEIKGNGIFTSW